MQDAIRYTFSGIMGFLITLTLFFGMKSLLGDRAKIKDNDFLDFKISYVKAEIETKQRSRQRKKPPEPEKSSQPPAAPKLNVAQNNKSLVDMLSDYNNGKNLNILKNMGLPGLNVNIGKPSIDNQGGLKAGIPPIYPPKALLNNIEGWVHVKISVNAFGSVDDVLVLNSEPARLFDEAALKAVRKWAFHQKKINDTPVPFEFTQTIEFKLGQPIEID